MKACCRCGGEGPFHKRVSGGDYPHCKKCQNAYTRAHYQKNKAVYIAKAVARTERLYRDLIVPIKNQPCADCHHVFPTVCMDFDHVRGEKKFDIAVGYKLYAMAVVLEEIEKCDIVCSNCHRIRTSKRVLGC